jgi:hypothetical protein
MHQLKIIMDVRKVFVDDGRRMGMLKIVSTDGI